MTDPQAPVGIFDSGIGGLTVLHEIRNVLPAENIIYVADSLYAPYGENSAEFILSRSLRCAEFLVSNKAKCIVIASNTATACAAQELRQRYSLPIIATEPPVKPAIEAPGSKIIGVLVTVATSSSRKYEYLMRHASAAEKIITQPCPGLVKQIEAQGPGGEQTLKLLEQYLRPLIDEKIDTLVLGCTHYPYLEKQIREIVGPGVAIIDPSLAIARHLKRRLEAINMLNDDQSRGLMQFWTSGSSEYFAEILARSQYPFGFSRKEYMPCTPDDIKDNFEFNVVDPSQLPESGLCNLLAQSEDLLL